MYISLQNRKKKKNVSNTFYNFLQIYIYALYNKMTCLTFLNVHFYGDWRGVTCLSAYCHIFAVYLLLYAIFKFSDRIHLFAFHDFFKAAADSRHLEADTCQSSFYTVLLDINLIQCSINLINTNKFIQIIITII